MDPRENDRSMRDFSGCKLSVEMYSWTNRSLCLESEHLIEKLAVVEESSRIGNMKSESVFQSLSLGWSLWRENL